MTRPSEAPSRFTGIGLVAAVHLLAIWALVSGLSNHWKKTEPSLAQVDLIEKTEPPPPPPKIVQIEAPSQQLPDKVQIVVPEITIIETSDRPLIQTRPLDVGLTTSTPGTSVGVVEKTPGTPTVAKTEKPGAICTRMGQPEAPAMNWSGDAVLRVLATVQAGRVTGVEWLAVSGVGDARARRAMQAAVENTLRSSYECPGEHRFEQEFRFRID
ncbi:hypothetical protein [Roseateles aquae]|nr:hypothetical protein [Paucibacter sp. APW11]